MPHNPASIVRLLYGERAAEEKTKPILFSSWRQFDTRPSIGQGPHGISVYRPSI